MTSSRNGASTGYRLTTSNRGKKALLAVATALALAAVAPAARAQSPEELKQARELFSEAYKDEQEKRFDQALEKFQRVAKVKESASVRYRIASVLESLNRLREARDAFRALAASKPNLPPNEQEIADSAAQRALLLDKKIPRLVLRHDSAWPEGTRVTVDGGLAPVSTTPRAIEVDPGDHTIAASAPGVQPSEHKVTVAPGGEVNFNIPPPAGAAAGPNGPGNGQGDQPSGNATHPTRTIGYVALGAGGVLLVTGVILLVVREGEISDIEKQCPGNVCPAASRTDVESSRDSAETLGPVGVGLSVAGLVVGGVGAYLVLRKGSPAAAPTSPTPDAAPPTTSSSLRIGPRAVRGGAILGLQGTF